jgi:outer membrane protein assembly factor BamA
MDKLYPIYFFKSVAYRFPAVFRHIFIAFSALILLNGCRGTGKLPEGKKLFTGAVVKMKSDKPIPTEKEIIPQLEAVITPKPNASFLGLRPKLSLYNMMGKSDKGVSGWIKKKLGEAPVLYDSLNNKKVTDLMLNRLNNNGYFNSRIEVKKTERRKTVNLTYTAVVNEPYRIKEVIFPAGDSAATQLHRDITASQAGSRLKPGELYNLNTLISERQRIDSVLKNLGYFYFSPEYILFKADSSYHDHTIKLYVQLKPKMPARSQRAYTLNKIIIYTDYTVGYDTIPMKPPVVIRGFRYYPDENSLRAKRLLPSVFLQPGNLYARKDHALTLSRLMGLGLFKFVAVDFTESDSVKNQLNAALRLTPMLNQSFRAELEMTSKTNGFAGPGVNFSFRHRNLLRGAELLIITLRAGQETQVAKRNSDSNNNANNSALNSVELGVTADLFVPRVISPIKLPISYSEFVPKTRFRIGYEYRDRVNYFQLNGYNLSYSYIWRPKAIITHELTPINIQYTKLLNQTPAFDSLLERNNYLARTFEEQFIIGSMYYFTYNTQLIPNRKNNIYFNGGVDFSGNLLSLISGGYNKADNEPATIAGQPFSQYSKFDADFRYYYNFSKKAALATRMIIGLGFPYGNSSTLPYIKQYSIGGTNSIRAFRARSIGPGVYRDTTNSGFFDQTGDIKFETNVEYRFDLLSPYLEGALFVDAGNIWLSHKAPEKPGAEFHFNNFLNQLALGTGFGFRIDAQVVVIRFDIGIPIRVPYLKASEQTVLTIPPPTKDMVLNIAIGYPF